MRSDLPPARVPAEELKRYPASDTPAAHASDHEEFAHSFGALPQSGDHGKPHRPGVEVNQVGSSVRSTEIWSESPPGEVPLLVGC